MKRWLAAAILAVAAIFGFFSTADGSVGAPRLAAPAADYGWPTTDPLLQQPLWVPIRVQAPLGSVVTVVLTRTAKAIPGFNSGAQLLARCGSSALPVRALTNSQWTLKLPSSSCRLRLGVVAFGPAKWLATARIGTRQVTFALYFQDYPSSPQRLGRYGGTLFWHGIGLVLLPGTLGGPVSVGIDTGSPVNLGRRWHALGPSFVVTGGGNWHRHGIVDVDDLVPVDQAAALGHHVTLMRLEHAGWVPLAGAGPGYTSLANGHEKSYYIPGPGAYQVAEAVP